MNDVHGVVRHSEQRRADLIAPPPGWHRGQQEPGPVFGSPALSIVIPVLNEAAIITATLQSLAPCRERGVELIVVDGGSSDATVARAIPHADLVISAPPGRAGQMNAGAASASGKVLLFLHADTQLPAGADCLVIDALKGSSRVWGRFNVMISGRGVTLGVIAALMNFRSRLTGIATGDQCIFMTREAFVAAGRFPEIALMEDIALSRQLKRVSRPICLGQAAVTSGRRWECNGIASTVVTMWLLRFAYFLGVNPALLARGYRYGRRRR